MSRFHDILLGRANSAHPLYCRRKNFSLIWSAKSGCTMGVLWFLHHVGQLEQAAAFDVWPHNYRQDVLLASADYQADMLACDPANTTFVRIIRDPYKRMVAAFTSMWTNPAPLGVLMRERFGERMSFIQFLDLIAEMGTGRDVHTLTQRNEIENFVSPALVINIDKEDLFAGLNRFEKIAGLETTDFTAGLLDAEIKRISRAHHLKRFSTQDDWSAVEIGPNGIDGQWPAYAAFLTEETRAMIDAFYAPDIRAYRQHL